MRSASATRPTGCRRAIRTGAEGPPRRHRPVRRCESARRSESRRRRSSARRRRWRSPSRDWALAHPEPTTSSRSRGSRRIRGPRGNRGAHRCLPSTCRRSRARATPRRSRPPSSPAAVLVGVCRVGHLEDVVERHRFAPGRIHPAQPAHVQCGRSHSQPVDDCPDRVAPHGDVRISGLRDRYSSRRKPVQGAHRAALVHRSIYGTPSDKRVSLCESLLDRHITGTRASEGTNALETGRTSWSRARAR